MVFLPTKGHLIPIGQTGLAYNYLSLLISRPNSNRIHIGIAKNNCEKISGGVSNMPTTRNSIIKYGLAAINDALVTISLLIKRTVAMGISNAMPNAKTSLNIKLRY